MSEETVPRDPWSQRTKDWWFFAALGGACLALAYLFSPFATVLLFAATIVVVTWPLYTRVLARCRGRKPLAAVVTLLGLGFVVVGPFTTVIYLFALEAVAAAQTALAFVEGDGIEAEVDRLVAQLDVWKSMLDVRLTAWDLPTIDELLARYLPADFDPVAAVVGPLQDGLLALANNVGTVVPQVLNTLVGGSIHSIIFLFSVLSLYMEGPRVLDFFRRLSPMDDKYERRLFKVFEEFAFNLVSGSLATAALMGLVASVGYAIAGVPRVLFAGILTALFSFIPVVGAGIVWVPLCIYIGATQGIGWGVFLLLWSALFTGSVDNLVKPMFLRGSSNIHPLLIFLAVFGGIAWMGLPGILVGPVIVAFFLALYTIYCEDYLGLPPPENDDEGPGIASTLKAAWERVRALLPGS